MFIDNISYPLTRSSKEVREDRDEYSYVEFNSSVKKLRKVTYNKIIKFSQWEFSRTQKMSFFVHDLYCSYTYDIKKYHYQLNG